MTTLDEWRDIANASLNLSDRKLLGVLALVERAPDRDQVREVLDRMRPRLVRLRPPRPLTAQRLLFRPVEDLFDPPENYRAKIGRLSRQTIQPCWVIVSNLMDPGLLRRTNDGARTVDADHPSEVLSLGMPFWKQAAEILATFLDADHSIGRRRVGTDQVTITEDLRQQLIDIADILAIATEVETTKSHLPERPIRVLSEVDVELLTDVITRLGAASTQQVQTYLLVVLARMSRPGDLLQVLSDIALPCSTGERSALFTAVGTSALAALTNEAQSLRKATARVTDAATGAETAEQLVSRLTSLEQSLGGLRSRTVADQVQTARREIGSFVLDKVAVKADQTLFESLRPAAAPGQSAPLEPTVDQVETAEQSARSLRRCAKVAESVGVNREMEQKLAGVCIKLEREATARDSSGQTDERRLVRSVRLIEMIAGPDEAQRVLMSQFSFGGTEG